tara:strand:- start:654 stop:821 length:168 start_codon:yes stop_codon:yes gene_type:complete
MNWWDKSRVIRGCSYFNSNFYKDLLSEVRLIERAAAPVLHAKYKTMGFRIVIWKI